MLNLFPVIVDRHILLFSELILRFLQLSRDKKKKKLNKSPVSFSYQQLGGWLQYDSRTWSNVISIHTQKLECKN